MRPKSLPHRKTPVAVASVPPPAAIGREAARVRFDRVTLGTGGFKLAVRALPEPRLARPRQARFFNPVRGWVRRLERRASHYLARRVYPHFDAVAYPYDRHLCTRLMLSEAEIPVPGLAAGMDGVRVMLISDIHAGPFLSSGVIRAVLERAMALEPDIMILGGDLLTSQIAEFAVVDEALATLRAPLGVFAVLGNHDHYTEQPGMIRELLAGRRIEVLHNRSITLTRGGGRLTVAGVDDLIMGEPDLTAALRDTQPPVVLVSHNPDILFDAAEAGVALVLSGHTHGGQVRIPGLPVLVRQSRFHLDHGRFRAARTELVVTRGLGAVGIPLRVACPAEIVLLRLRGQDG